MSILFGKNFYLELKNSKSENDTNFISSIVLFFIHNTKNTLQMIYNEACLIISKHGT